MVTERISERDVSIKFFLYAIFQKEQEPAHKKKKEQEQIIYRIQPLEKKIWGSKKWSREME